MARCVECGADNAVGARFCSVCGARLRASKADSRPVRKLVTVVFTDITGFTSLAERLDPERLRRVMFRYFEEMRSIIERHGGTVEKFVGDAVMAVFGIPKLHEDDAHRAVHAAAEMRDALGVLNDELEREWGVRIQARTGVNTGEVVTWRTGEEDAHVLGDPVNVAARLQQSAAPQEILLGEPTYRLLRDLVEAEELEPLAVKGKGEPLKAYRLVEAGGAAGTRAPRVRAGLVGRAPELRSMQEAFDQMVEQRTCVALTVLGAAGVGKSRLASEFLRSVADQATVLQGQCLSYGEGITFWPVRQVVKQAAGILDNDSTEEAKAKIGAVLEASDDVELVTERVSQVLGMVSATAPLGETFWSVRKLFEALARERPVVVLFDDIHWAEPTFLELIEHVCDWSRGAPVLVMCLSRLDLLDERPEWGASRPNMSVMRLAPLSDEESALMIGGILGTPLENERLQLRINDAAEGNPLFIEEIVSMLVEEGLVDREGGEWVVRGDVAKLDMPPSLQTLLAARIDRLDPQDRQVIEVASVMGMFFYRTGLFELLPYEFRAGLDASLRTLAEKELVRPALAN